MRVVIQRVKQASVAVKGSTISSIGPGLVCLIGIKKEDTNTEADFIIKKILNSRVFEDAEAGGQWRKNVADVGGEILCVSQFTLYGRLRQAKPDYSRAMPPAEAKEMYAAFLQRLRDSYQAERVQDGEFGAMMDVALVNDGPVTFVIDSDGGIGVAS